MSSPGFLKQEFESGAPFMDGPPSESEEQRSELAANPLTERFLADSNGMNLKPMVAASAASRAFREKKMRLAQIAVMKTAGSDGGDEKPAKKSMLPTAGKALALTGATLLAGRALYKRHKKKKEEEEAKSKGINHQRLMSAYVNAISKGRHA